MDPPRTVMQEPGVHRNSFQYHVDDGFYYVYNGGNDSSIWFRCCKASCYGTAVLRVNDSFHHNQPHNHPPQTNRHHIQRIRRNIVTRAASTVRYVSFVDIVEEERRSVPDREIRAQLTYRRLRSAMQRSRASVYPNIPETLVQVSQVLGDVQWQHLTKTLDDSGSIYCCSVTAADGSHSIIFSSRRCLDILKRCEIIFLDGTFKITPTIDGCYQVFTIATVELHTVLPLVWCLMESKTENAYISVLLEIRARIVGWAFRLAVSDYEDAIINAVEKVFNVEVQGCFFHFVQALGSWGKSNIGLAALNMNPALLTVIRRCCALPLLPQNWLQRGMNVIVAEAQNDQALYNLIFPFLMYVQWDWIGHTNRGRTLSVCGSDHRTNNASESNNYRMRRRIQVAHPNIYHFIRCIAEFEDSTVDDKGSLSRGLIPNRHRAQSTVRNDAYIHRLVSQLQEIAFPSDDDISNFLNAASFSCENVMYDAMGIQNPRRQRQ